MSEHNHPLCPACEERRGVGCVLPSVGIVWFVLLVAVINDLRSRVSILEATHEPTAQESSR